MRQFGAAGLGFLLWMVFAGLAVIELDWKPETPGEWLPLLAFAPSMYVLARWMLGQNTQDGGPLSRVLGYIAIACGLVAAALLFA